MRRQMESQLPPTAGPSTTTSKGPAANLAARRTAGEVHADPVQEKVVQKLQAIYEQLVAMADHPAPKPGFFARLGLAPAAKPPAGPRGLYIWGPVGRGKSMLMDLFFADVPMARKRRVHFHEFMLEVQERLHRRREELAAKGAPPEADTIVPIAKQIASETRLLCFDEFQVTNIADAMILARLFEVLFDEGLTVIATSNRKPDDLYKDGLQRERFLPFIDLVKERLEVMELGGDHDYRLDRLRNFDVYLTPLGAWANAKLDEAFRALERRRRRRAARAAHPGPRRRDPARRAGRRHGGFPRLVREAHGRRRLHLHRRQLPHRDRGRHPQDGTGQPGQGGALRHHDRRILRKESEVHLLCCNGAERPLPSRATAPSSSSARSRG